MKFNIKSAILGCIVGIMVSSSVSVLAYNGTQNISATFKNIRIFVNGSELTPRDSGGNVLEPFIYNGSTYLPVRAVCEAVGKNVSYDANTNSIYIGKSNQFNDSKELSIDDNIGDSGWSAVGDLEDNYGNTYTRALSQEWSSCDPSKEEPYEVITGGKYNRLKGTIYVKKGCSKDDTAQVVIKADNKTIYTSPAINKTSKPIPFDINISNYNDIKIILTGGNMDWDICIGNAELCE